MVTTSPGFTPNFSRIPAGITTRPALSTLLVYRMADLRAIIPFLQHSLVYGKRVVRARAPFCAVRKPSKPELCYEASRARPLSDSHILWL